LPPCETTQKPLSSLWKVTRSITPEISSVAGLRSGIAAFLRVKARGQRDETTVIGSLPSVTAGEWLSAEGWWVRDKEHGLQFKATTMKTVPPTTAEGIERYLGSGLVKGIGPILAKKLVGRFGAEVLAVIENRAAELQTVDGIGPKRRERIAHAWQEAKQLREIMVFLHSHGVSTSRAVRIFKTYGEQAIEKVQSNPYMLAKDIYGIGFATADQIAQKVGIPRDSLNRARAGIDHVLLEATSDGHCALPLEKLKLAAVKLLEVPEGTVEQALSQMLTSGSLLLEEIDGDALIFLPHLRRAEVGIAARIKKEAAAAHNRGIHLFISVPEIHATVRVKNTNKQFVHQASPSEAG
jgi:exodeoxyribonuclease V alpha subunit